MKRSFVTSPIVKEFVENPLQLWDNSANLGKRGVNYIIKKVFIDATSREVRVKQIDSKLRILAKEVINLIGQYYHSGDYNKVLQERVTKVMSLIKEITYSMSKYNSFGSILDSLNIEEKIPWKTMFDLNNPIYSYGDIQHHKFLRIIHISGKCRKSNPGQAFR